MVEVERINSEKIIFVTSQHLILNDVIWMFVLMLQLLFIMVLISRKIQNFSVALLIVMIIGIMYF